MNDGTDDILAYLAENPAAEDTFEGIHWWVLRRYVQKTTSQLRCALAAAIAAGWVEEREATAGRRLYRLTPGRAAELQALMNQRPNCVC